MLNKYMYNCEIYTESIEVIFRNKEEVYKYKPDVFVMCE